jgi:hypothetical protein
VDGTGLQKAFECKDVANYFKTPTCDGQAYASCDDGECSLTPGEFFAQPLSYLSSATGCFFGEPSEAEVADFFRRIGIAASSAADITRVCRSTGGTVVTVPQPCRRNTFLCADCCTPAGTRLRLPVHTFDASLLGTPRFRLSQ